MPREGDFAEIDWGVLPPDHIPATMDELVDGWIVNNAATSATPIDRPLDGDRPHFWAWEVAAHLAYQHPEQAMAFIVAMLARPIADDTRFSLAAGPLEDVLAYNGPAVIGDVERLARQDARFRDTLQGVWRNAMSEEIWRRVRVARLDPDIE